MSNSGLAGLAAEWEASGTVRRRVCWDDCLLAWRSPEQVGVPSYDVAAMNYDALRPFFELWSSNNLSPRSPQVSAILPEAPLGFAQLLAKHAYMHPCICYVHIYMYIYFIYTFV